jgi:hypothetical protein
MMLLQHEYMTCEWFSGKPPILRWILNRNVAVWFNHDAGQHDRETTLYVVIQR